MLRKFVPNEVVDTVFDIEPQDLLEKGIKGVITDLDNTLVAWDVANATDEIIVWLKQLADHDIKVTIVSNNNEERVRVFAEPIEHKYVAHANKPLTGTFKRIRSEMNLEKHEIVVVGDQLLTDIFGGNRAGLKTILVTPIVQTDAPITRFNRMIERKIMRRLERKKLIKWEE